MNDTEIKELNELASSCRAIYDDGRFDKGYRMANLINARDVCAIAEKYGDKGRPRDTAIWLKNSCEKFLKKESELGNES